MAHNKHRTSRSRSRVLDGFRSNRAYAHRDQRDIVTVEKLEQERAQVPVPVLVQVQVPELELGWDKIAEEVLAFQWLLRVVVASLDQLVHCRAARLLRGPSPWALDVQSAAVPFETELA